MTESVTDSLPWWGPARLPFLLLTPACLALAVAGCLLAAQAQGMSLSLVDAAGSALMRGDPREASRQLQALETYLRAARQAIDAARQITGADQVNVLAACAGAVATSPSRTTTSKTCPAAKPPCCRREPPTPPC